MKTNNKALITLTKQISYNPPYMYTCVPITPMMKRVESMEALADSRETAGIEETTGSKRSKTVSKQDFLVRYG
jgi:hypothetical protein